ncbi:MAG: hypothetical protein K2L38_03245 [Dysosmobacter sp.]|nr:hypothetical protein [Dysosmobacter sp.]
MSTSNYINMYRFSLLKRQRACLKSSETRSGGVVFLREGPVPGVLLFFKQALPAGLKLLLALKAEERRSTQAVPPDKAVDAELRGGRKARGQTERSAQTSFHGCECKKLVGICFGRFPSIRNRAVESWDSPAFTARERVADAPASRAGREERNCLQTLVIADAGHFHVRVFMERCLGRGSVRVDIQRLDLLSPLRVG